MNGTNCCLTGTMWYKSSDDLLNRPRFHNIPPQTSTQRVQALALLKRRGMTRLTELRDVGITAATVPGWSKPAK